MKMKMTNLGINKWNHKSLQYGALQIIVSFFSMDIIRTDGDECSQEKPDGTVILLVCPVSLQ